MIDLYLLMWKKTLYLPFYPILHPLWYSWEISYLFNEQSLGTVCQAPNQIVWLHRCLWVENVCQRDTLYSQKTAHQVPLRSMALISRGSPTCHPLNGADGDTT